MEKVAKASGANYSFHKEASSRFQDSGPQGPVVCNACTSCPAPFCLFAVCNGLIRERAGSDLSSFISKWLHWECLFVSSSSYSLKNIVCPICCLLYLVIWGVFFMVKNLMTIANDIDWSDQVHQLFCLLPCNQTSTSQWSFLRSLTFDGLRHSGLCVPEDQRHVWN